MTESDAGQAIRATLDAFRRGTKRSRLRLLAVVCSNGHTLLEVFPTLSGPVALWSAPEYGPRPRRTEWCAAFVSASHDGGAEEHEVEESARVHCRCFAQTTVEFTWVEEQLVTARRRVVAP